MFCLSFKMLSERQGSQLYCWYHSDLQKVIIVSPHLHSLSLWSVEAARVQRKITLE